MKLLPELRLLAVQKGKAWEVAFDRMVVPWARQALGNVPHELAYDTNLSLLQSISLPSTVCRAGDRGHHVTHAHSTVVRP